jgi:heptosyltransferase I
LRILIVKTSSLGDVIHTLPALTDAARAIPGLQADWVVEETFAEVPAWHPVVADVFPVAVRRWRKNWLASWRSGELGACRRQIRARQYDLVIDAQGLLKSALITLQARGPTVGFSRDSIREPLASFCYQQTCSISRTEHAVQRLRRLFATALGYQFDQGMVDYGINSRAMAASAENNQTLMFLHGTSWPSKHWPEAYWRQLALMAGKAGFQVLLPWGSLAEQARAVRIAEGLAHVRVLDRHGLDALAELIRCCAGVVSVDTGLGHLAAALNRPNVSLYGATNPALSGTFGHHQLHLQADLPCAPCGQRNCRYQGEALYDLNEHGQAYPVQPPCYRAMSPGEVLGHLQRLLKRRAHISAAEYPL